MLAVNLPSVRRLMAYTVLVVAVACSWPGRARATQCRVPAGYSDKLASYDAETRLAWLEARLHKGGVYSTWWSASWGVIYGGLTVGQLALLPTSANEGERDEKYVGAAFPADCLRVFGGVRRGHVQHRNTLRGGRTLDAPADFEPADVGQAHVEQHQRRLALGDEAQRVATGHCLANLEAGAAKDV